MVEQNSINRSTRGIIRIFISLILPLVILSSAIIFFKHQMDTRPKAKRTPPPRQARLVTVEPLKRINTTVIVEPMGTVIAAKEITLNPEVSGVITSVDPIVTPGGIVEKGQVLFTIDSRDYETVVKQRESEVAQARLNLRLESGSQTVARQEYSMLEEVIDAQDQDLLLRKPHLEQVKASLDAAEALLARARLDVQRCTIRAPFNAIIKDKYQDVGARVSTTSALVSLTGIDEYWVKVSISEPKLRWIQIPVISGQEGSKAKIFNLTSWKNGQFREGQVIKLIGELEEQGRMAQVLVSVKDPLSLHQEVDVPPLLIGSYVRVEIEGVPLENVFEIQREYLRDGHFVWIMNEENKLEIRPVDILFPGKDQVYISNNLREGERMVTTDLSAPVEGMALRTGDMRPEAESGQGRPAAEGKKNG